jgi:hypothetical protein
MERGQYKEVLARKINRLMQRLEYEEELEQMNKIFDMIERFRTVHDNL